MLIKTAKGWAFDDSPAGRAKRLEFEAGMMQDDVAESLLSAALKAISLAKAKQVESWRDIQESIGLDSEAGLAYNWITGEITEAPQKDA